MITAVNKKMIAPVVVALVLVGYYIFVAVLFLTVAKGVSIVVKTVMVVVPLIVVGFVVWALVERIKEIRSGEEDDLSQY